MSRTYIHKEEGKYNNGIDQKNVSVNLQKKWNRHNFDADYFRAERKAKKEKQAEIDMQNELISIKESIMSVESSEWRA